MKAAAKKYFCIPVLAVLLCLLLAGCSGSATGGGRISVSDDPAPSTGTASTTLLDPGCTLIWTYHHANDEGLADEADAKDPHCELVGTYEYESDEELAEAVQKNGFLILKETVDLTADGKVEQIVTEAAIWADALYGTAESSGTVVDSLQAAAALQAMENGLFAPACNTIELFADNSEVLVATFTYQYSYDGGGQEPAAATLEKVTVQSSCDGYTVSVTYARQPDGTMAAQNSDGDAESRIEQILQFVASPARSLGETISSAETLELVSEMGESALADVQELVQEEGYTCDILADETDLYEAGTQHMKALDHTWELYRYATEDELYLRGFYPQPAASTGLRFVADMYDCIVDSTGQTATNTVTLQRAVGAEREDGTVAAVYILYIYGVVWVRGRPSTVQSIEAVGIDGVPAEQADALLYANSFADLLAIARANEGVTMGYDTFTVDENALTLVRDDNSAAWQSTETEGSTAGSAAQEEVGLSAADEDDPDDLDDLATLDDLDDLDAMMGVDTGTTDADGQGSAAESMYFPYADTYEANVAIMDGIWSVLLQKADPGDGEIGQYALQTIDAAYAALYEAEALAEEVFEGA
jgi:hypothetical protein